MKRSPELGIYVATLVGGWSEILRTDEKSLVDNYACAHFHLISNEAERRSGLLSKSTYLRAVEKLQRLALTIDEEIDEISLLIRARKLKIEIANYVNGYDGVD